jgi:hypothetical protein
MRIGTVALPQSDVTPQHTFTLPLRHRSRSRFSLATRFSAVLARPGCASRTPSKNVASWIRPVSVPTGRHDRLRCGYRRRGLEPHRDIRDDVHVHVWLPQRRHITSNGVHFANRTMSAFAPRAIIAKTLAIVRAIACSRVQPTPSEESDMSGANTMSIWRASIEVARFPLPTGTNQSRSDPIR